MLTALVTTPPVSAAVTCSAVTTPARSWASAVEAPRWGVTTTSSRAKIGCSVKGSEGKTSSAAPPSLPDSRPASSASRSTSSPRAQLTRRAPSFIAAIVSASIRPIVSGVFGTCRVTRSERPSTSSTLSSPSTPSSRKRSAETNLSKATTSISKLWARLATSWPMRPKPITPSVLP